MDLVGFGRGMERWGWGVSVVDHEGFGIDVFSVENLPLAAEGPACTGGPGVETVVEDTGDVCCDTLKVSKRTKKREKKENIGEF